jgi:hypothetical protein
LPGQVDEISRMIQSIEAMSSEEVLWAAGEMAGKSEKEIQ